jgi:hypothetical protein
MIPAAGSMIMKTAFGFSRRLVNVRFAPRPMITVASSVIRGEPITATSTLPSLLAVPIVPIRGCWLKYSISCDMISLFG